MMKFQMLAIMPLSALLVFKVALLFVDFPIIHL